MEKNFDKEKFSKILNEIYKTYPNQRNFASAMGISRGYLSQYINKKLKNPPTPKVLKKIAESSKALTTYEDLLIMCGYADSSSFGFGIIDNSITTIPLFKSMNGELYQDTDLIVNREILKEDHQYFSYKTQDDSMSPLLGKGDIAIIEKTDTYENDNTCLISLDNKEILIRKIKEKEEYIELHTIIQKEDIKIVLKSDFEKRNFKILGKIIKVENESAFK